jgi:hypothetical protein
MYIQGYNYDLRRLLKDKGVKWFRDHIVGTLMESKEGVDGEDSIVRYGDFSVQELHEAVDSSEFPVIMGDLISKKMIAGYDMIAKVGDSLVTKMPSKKKIDRIPGLERENALQRVGEGMPYPETARIEEKYVDVEGYKRGEILDITEETVLFDQTNQILKEASRIGEDAAMEREEHIVNTIQDIASYKAWYPSGTQVDLYQNATTAPHTYDNLITNALADHTDIDAALQLFAGFRNRNGKPIAINPTTLLVPAALLITAKTVLGSGVRIGDYNDVPNPVQGMFQIVSTAFLDMQSTIIWYLGQFKKQFIWKEVMPFQVLRRKKDSEDGWRRDIIASFKARYYGECAALDYVYVVKSTGAA